MTKTAEYSESKIGNIVDEHFKVARATVLRKELELV